MGRRVLVLYYSWSNGNTERVAQELADACDADVERIETAELYPEDYDATVDQGKREVEAGFEPELQPLEHDPADYDVVLVCGPTVMMRNAARLCAEKGTPCFVSMEKKMACGIGACLGCTCETKSGEGKSVCKNGPVFDATEVFF